MHSCETIQDRNPIIGSEYYITSTNNFTNRPGFPNNRVTSCGQRQSSSTIPVFRKRKVGHSNEERASNVIEKRRRYDNKVSISRIPLQCHSMKENVCSVKHDIFDRIGSEASPAEVECVRTPPFLEVLAKLGKTGAPALAREIQQLNVSKFPMDAMAEKLADKMVDDHKAVESCLDVAVVVRSLLGDLRQSIINPTTDIKGKLADFDQVSQSFGLKNALNHLDFLDQCISCVCSKLSKKNEALHTESN